MRISLLDCTLRDGGYVNDFSFSHRQVRSVIECLNSAGIDYIEAGFLRDSKNATETTIYTDVRDVEEWLPPTLASSDIFLMIVYGKFSIERVPPQCETRVRGLRVTFKKDEIDDALAYCRVLIEKGYKVSFNPTGINGYSDIEILKLVDAVNALQPFCFSIVDTLGVLTPPKLLRIYWLLEHNLHESIAIGFHSHNNLQLSFANAMALMNMRTKRHLIIDTCLFGMGRGAGNLSTELMVQHMSENDLRHYRLLPILKAIDEQIAKIYAVAPWGYSIPYYLAASVKCHPNYASYLMEKQTISIEAINAILQRIPEEKKVGYDAALIKQLYLECQTNAVDDAAIVDELRQRVEGRTVMMLAPGQSIKTHQDAVQTFMDTHHPFVFSLNFTPQQYPVDITFISNAKRFAEHKGNENLLITSNIKAEGVPVLNYASYLNNSEMYDNAALMLMVLLIKIGVRDIWLAGMDGFSTAAQDYADSDMINKAKLDWFDKRNSIMKEMLQKYSRQVQIHFITPSLYEFSR